MSCIHIRVCICMYMYVYVCICMYMCTDRTGPIFNLKKNMYIMIMYIDRIGLPLGCLEHKGGKSERK